MYRKIEDFIADLKNESESTIKLFGYIPDNVGTDKPNENIRSILKLSSHITHTVGEMMNKAGLDVYTYEETELPRSVSKIKEAYIKSVNDLIVKASALKEADLETETNMYGENWKRGVTFSILIKHEIHHRGQLTTLMRLAGLKVPGLYGPSKEEWATYGMPAHE